MSYDQDHVRRPYPRSLHTEFDSNVEAARYYAAELGWPVFPCYLDKRPATAHGFKDATTGEEQIEEWWAEDPSYSIGCSTGERSSFFVLDLDLKNDGPQNLLDLLERYNGGVDFVTRQSKTGSGGYHHLFAYPQHRTVTNSPGALPKGMDIRGEGGYIILPPSGHPSGSEYEWVSPAGIQPAPPWLLDLIARPKPKTEPRGTAADDGVIPEGERNTTLTSIAGKLRRIGLSEQEMYAALLEIAAQRCAGYFSEEECRTIAHSVARYEPHEGLLDVEEEFATDAAPDDYGLVWYTGEDIRAMEFPDPWFLAWPLFGAAMVSIIAGKWKSAGKTTLALSAVKAMLDDTEFFARAVTSCPIVYLYEGSPIEFKTSIRDAHLDESDMSDLHVLLRSHNTTTRWSVTVKGAIDKAIALGAGYIIIDTRDEWLEQEGKAVNDAGSVRAVLRELMVAKREGIGVAILAHTPKGNVETLEDLIAGSGQWGAGVDWLVGLWRDENADAGSKQREIECIGRMGASENIPRSVIDWNLETGEYRWLGDKDSVTESARLRELADLVDPAQEYRLRDLADICGETTDTVRMAVKRDKTETFVRVGHGRYKLNTKGDPEANETNTP